MSTAVRTITKAPARKLVGAQSKSSSQNRTSKSSGQKRLEVLKSKSKSKPRPSPGRAESLTNPVQLANLSMPIVNRESWLSSAIELLRPEFIAQGSPLPPLVRASIGWTKNRKALAECWASSSTSDGANEIFLIPTNKLDDPLEIFGILCHELCHAALPHGIGHKKPFIALGHKMLLEGNPKSLTGGEAFRERWSKPLQALGPFPAPAMTVPVNASRGGSGNPKKRKHKMVCTHCSMTFRLAEKWISPGLQCPDRDCIGLMETK